MGFWDGKRVLVTGANGFAGSNLCHLLLEDGANVRAFVKRGGILTNLFDIQDKIQIVRGDLTDFTSVFNATKDIDIVFHAGAIVPVTEARNVPSNTFNVNILGTFNVAWAANNNNVKKMVHISTCHVYGNQPENKLPIKEDVIPNPNDVYSASKYSAEIILRPFINQGFDISITRAFNHYGPCQRGDYFVPKVISQVLKGQAPKLGNPNPTRDYSYVRDIVSGYMLVAEFGQSGEIYHFCSGKELKMGDFCNKIIEACSSDIKPVWESDSIRKQDISRLYGDYSKAKKEFGWKPTTSLEEGLRLTVDWWKNNLELLKI